MRAIDPSDNIDASPASYGWTITAPGAPNTPAGADVTVVTGAATVQLLGVSAAGSTVADALVGSAPLPPGYTAGAFYDVASTAAYLDVGSVCFTYDALAFAGPVRLLAVDGDVWVDVTTTDAAPASCAASRVTCPRSRSRARRRTWCPRRRSSPGPPTRP